MLRINLLPPYIYEGSRRKKVVAFWVFALAAVIGGVLYIKSTIDSETEKAVQDKTAATPDAEEMKKKRAEAQKINGESAGIRGKADFVKGANEHSTKSYQKVVQNIAAYTWPKVMYDGIVADGASATMPAYAPSLADVGHYMIYMSHNKEISKVDVQMSSIPGFPDGGAGGQSSQASGVRPFDGSGHNFNVTLSLVTPVGTAPSYPSAGGGGQQAGGGFPGGGNVGAGSGGGMSGGSISAGDLGGKGSK